MCGEGEPPNARNAAPTLGLLDRPSRRKRHCGVVPVVGGLGVFLGLLVGSIVVLLTLQDAFPAVERSFACLVGAAVLLLVAGILDDEVGGLPKIRTGSWANRRPERHRLTPPCNDGCPAGNDVRGFVQAVGDKAYDSHREQSLQYRLHASLCGRVGLVLPPAKEEDQV